MGGGNEKNNYNIPTKYIFSEYYPGLLSVVENSPTGKHTLAIEQ